MIGTLSYVVLMHRCSPIAWFGHKRKWLRLREAQSRARAHRNYPDYFPPVYWSQIVGLRDFVGEVPEVNGRGSPRDPRMYWADRQRGKFSWWLTGWRRWLFPVIDGEPDELDLKRFPGLSPESPSRHFKDEIAKDSAWLKSWIERR